MTYERRIAAGLDRALERAPRRPLDLGTARCVILSDQHKGKRDRADDFVRSEPAYNAALGYYLEAGYTLLALGDVEELWECRARDVIRAYPRTLDLEAQFHAAGRYLRFYGNHDDDWSSPHLVRRHLGPLFPELEVLEGLVLEVTDAGRLLGSLFLVHGHQGTTFGDRLRAIGRFFVRTFWRPFQRLTGIRTTTPSTSFVLRERHDLAMYAWAARQHGLVLVAGHTHRPVFIPEPGSRPLERRLEQLRAGSVPAGGEEIAALRAEVEFEKTLEQPGPSADRPCYFNTGCCCFSDGDITGLEIAEGRIALVRWPDDEGRPRKKVLRSADLAAVLERCGAPASA